MGWTALPPTDDKALVIADGRVEMGIEMLGIDLAKNVFQLHGVDRRGRRIYKRRVLRDQLLSVVGDIPHCTVVMEACTGAFHWARQFEALGHRVTIISPQYVKPFVRRQKNEGNDAEAIATAARQPHIPHVPKKTVRIFRLCTASGSGWSITGPR